MLSWFRYLISQLSDVCEQNLAQAILNFKSNVCFKTILLLKVQATLRSLCLFIPPTPSVYTIHVTGNLPNVKFDRFSKTCFQIARNSKSYVMICHTYFDSSNCQYKMTFSTRSQLLEIISVAHSLCYIIHVANTVSNVKFDKFRKTAFILL